MGAQAEVLSHAKRQMTIRVTVDAKLEGVLEDLFITIRRWVEECEVFALGDLAAAKLSIIAGGAAEVDDRTRPTNDLLHRPLQGALDGSCHAPTGSGERYTAREVWGPKPGTITLTEPDACPPAPSENQSKTVQKTP